MSRVMRRSWPSLVQMDEQIARLEQRVVDQDERIAKLERRAIGCALQRHPPRGRLAADPGSSEAAVCGPGGSATAR